MSLKRNTLVETTRWIAILVLLAGTTLACSSGASLTASEVVAQINLTSTNNLLGPDGGATTMEATVVDSAGAPVASVQVTFETSSGSFKNSNVVRTDTAGKARALLQTESRAIVTARVLDVVSNEVVIDVEIPVKFMVETEPKDPVVDQPVDIRIVALNKEDETGVSGELEIDFDDGTTETFSDFFRRVDVTHVYSSVEGFRLQLRLDIEESRQVVEHSERIKVREPVPVELRLDVENTVVNEPTRVIVDADRKDGKVTRGKAEIDYGDGHTDSINNFEDKASRTHKYTEKGEFKVAVDFTGEDGAASTTETTTVKITETGGGGGNFTDAEDQLNLDNVVFLHSNVSNWDITSKVTGVSIEFQLICIFHTAAATWPAPNGTYGNPWVAANIDGTWYAGTFEWMRPGQECKALDPDAGGRTIAQRIGPHVKVEPLQSWVPRKGETVGFFYSGWARDARRSIRERSNVVLVDWPWKP